MDAARPVSKERKERSPILIENVYEKEPRSRSSNGISGTALCTAAGASQPLAERLGISLSEQRAYSLAELYHFKDVQSSDRLKEGHERIGFAAP